MTIERTFDYELLKHLATADERLYETLGDDWAPPIAEYQGPPRTNEVTYLLASDDAGILGFFMFVPRSAICWEMHTVMPLFGARAIEAMKEACAWVFANTQCVRIVTFVPEHNEVAQRFARQAGLKAWGRNKKSYQKGGVLQDEIWLGIGET